MPETLCPPVNFSLVSPGVYRSGFPTRHNLGFLQNLGLRTIITLEAQQHPSEVRSWMDHHNISLLQYTMSTNKEPFVVTDPAQIRRALRTLLNPEAHPVLVHSLRGQARVSVVIGCLRKLQRWSLSAIFDEYRLFTRATAALLDLQVIELFDVDYDLADAEADAEDEVGEADGSGADAEAVLDEAEEPPVDSLASSTAIAS
jgi:tyrosine-protein phosphatase SIW14